MATPNIVMKKKRVESEDAPAQEGVASFDGPDLSVSEVEVAKPEDAGDKAELLKFMEENVTITIHESPIDSMPVVDVGVNGVNEFFVRGVAKVTKRKYLDKLARSRQTHYSMDEKEGGSVIDYRWRTAQRYPFSVEEDTAKGREWLKRVLRGERA